MTKHCLFMLLLYYIGKGDMQCNITNCNSCNGSNCQRCQSGYVLKSNRCYRCSTYFVSCSSCNGSERCITCVSGKYGQYCQDSCNRCLNGVCNIDSGTCTAGCVAGFYWKDHRDCEQCPTNCKTCENDVSCTSCEIGRYLQTSTSGFVSCASCPSRCLSCTDGYTCTECRQPSNYWGSTCQNFCRNCSGSCHIIDGCSIGCNARYYKKFSSFTNGYECKACPAACSSCTSETECQKCKTKYWGSQCQNSCNGCSGYCYEDRGCFNGCQDGYYGMSYQGGTACITCPSNCQTCSDLSTCDTCKTGFNGTFCQYNCGHCSGKVCYSDTGECIFNCRSDQYFNGVEEGCKPCPKGCTECISAWYCTNCRLGKWGNICEYNCSQNCQNEACAKSSGYCSNGCKEGFYGNNCSFSCLPGCKLCTNQWYCAACKTGYFSKENNYKCECTDEYCKRRDFGLCTQCASLQWYPHDSGCCSCSSNCENNTCFSNRTCINCIPGKYGDQCLHICSSQCRDSLCYRDGSCISCKYGYKFGLNCQAYCHAAITYCDRCFGQDTNSVTCTRCNNGRYVENNKCKPCSSHCKYNPSAACNSTTGSCYKGCNVGYYGDKCDSPCNVTNCLKCPSNHNECKECNAGFYNQTNSVCSKCSANCRLGTTCNKLNGSCESGCLDGWSGHMCSLSCPVGCIKCEQYNSSSCNVCHIDMYGDQCEKSCSQNCKISDGEHTCSKNNGHCEHGCKDRFWGQSCEIDCSAGCNGSICNRTSGACKNGCTNEFYGGACKTQCNKHCVSTEINAAGRSCHEETGDCLNGCESGWFGGTCEKECSKHCNGTECDRHNGTCTFGCIEGYIGSACSQAKVSASEGSTDTAAIGAGAGAGVALLVILVGVAFVIYWRQRRSLSKLGKHDTGVVQVPPDSNQTNQDLVYSNIDNNRMETDGPGATSVANQLYANVRMSDISKGEDTNTTVEIARPVSEDYLNEDEIIDGELPEETESDAEEVDCTYYNVAGKRVAIVNLPEYIKNKSRGDIYADFQRIPKGLLKDYKEAKKRKNVHKNKYRFIYPYDESRVILDDGGSDYMNASYIEGYNNKKEYIASSGPFKKSYDTTPDFWRMIWQERCENIVMLTNPVENEETKCAKYWPEPGASSTFGKLQVASVTEDQYSDFTIRILTVTKGGENFSVRHLHFTAWPDKGVPHDVTSMIEFRQKVRSLHKNKNCPLLVHCSAGIGRTGTFIALDMLTFEGENRGSVDIFDCVAALRSQRCNMVQTKEQYDYLHHAVLHSLTFDCRSIAGDMFLQNYNKLIERNGGKRIIDIQFQHLQSTTDEITDEDKVDVLRNQSLPHKNRESADIPVDEYRVKFRENRKPGAVDYINAVWINGFRTRHKFIVAQTPLPSTVVDFLTLVHQEKCSCIVMMEEADISNKSVGVYWPADNQSIKHGVFKISCKDSTSTRHYAKKTLSITCHGSKGEDIHDVHLFIFTNWPKGNAVPKTSDSVLQFVKAVDTVNRSKDKESTILVHCMTGSERSCVYCAVSVLIEKMEIEHEVSVVNTLGQIKARRRSAFSSLDQYKFCHQAVISYLQSFDTYSNFGLRDSEASSV